MKTELPPIDPRCSCCGNAYDTRYLCERCRKDPANADWIEGKEDITENDFAAPSNRRPEWNEQPVWKPTPQYRRIVKLLVEGVAYEAIARRVRCSKRYVRKIAEEVGLVASRSSLGSPLRSRPSALRVRVRRLRDEGFSYELDPGDETSAAN